MFKPKYVVQHNKKKEKQTNAKKKQNEVKQLESQKDEPNQVITDNWR